MLFSVCVDSLSAQAPKLCVSNWVDVVTKGLSCQKLTGPPLGEMFEINWLTLLPISALMLVTVPQNLSVPICNIRVCNSAIYLKCSNIQSGGKIQMCTWGVEEPPLPPAPEDVITYLLLPLLSLQPAFGEVRVPRFWQVFEFRSLLAALIIICGLQFSISIVNLNSSHDLCWNLLKLWYVCME